MIVPKNRAFLFILLLHLFSIIGKAEVDLPQKVAAIRTKLHSTDTNGVAQLWNETARVVNKTSDSVSLYHLYAIKGEILFNESGKNNAPAFENYFTALTIAIRLGSDSLLAAAYFNLGEKNYQFNNYGPGLKNLLKARSYYEKLNKKDNVANIDRINGVIYMYNGSTDEAIRLFHRARKYFENVGDEKNIASVYNNLGIAFTEKNDSLRAMECFYKSLTLEEKRKDTFKLGRICNNIGNLLLKAGQCDRALSYFRKGYELRKKVDTPLSGLAESQINIGKAFFCKGETANAKSELEHGLRTARECNNPEIQKRALEKLKDIYFTEGDLKKAYEAQSLYISLRDSVFGLDKSEDLMRVSASEVFERKIERDSLITAQRQQKELAVQQEKDKRQFLLVIVLISGMLILVAIAFLLFKRNNEKKRTNAIIVEQRDELKAKQKEIIDSINYAKKIQQSQLPNEKYMERTFNRL